MLFFIVQSNAQEWLVYDGSVIPDQSDPAFEISTNDYGEFGADSTSAVISDPTSSDNDVLEFITADPAKRFLWRINNLGLNPAKGATFMFRVKPLDFDTYDRTFEIDIRAGGVREKVVLRGSDRIQLERAGEDATGLENMQYWHTFRVTYFDSVTNVYMDENPVAVVSGKTPDAAADDYFRFGDGSGSSSYGGLVDWVMWDTTGVYAPGEGASIPENLYVDQYDAKRIVVVHDPGLTNSEGKPGDQALIDTLSAEGYNVLEVSTGAISAEAAEFIETLNNADLVIMGRSINSGTTDGADKPVWNSISAPMLVFSPWCVRNSRLGWFNSGTSTQVNNGVTLTAVITMPGDDVFSGITLTDDKMTWATGAYDYISVKNPGNATLLAVSETDSNVLFARFDPWTFFYDGSSDFASGYRTYIGNGNDAAGPVNYFNFSDDGATVFLNEVARMVALPEPPEKPVGLGYEIAFVSLPGKDNPDTPEPADADTPFINELLALQYKVTPVYTTSLETASAGLLDTLNDADLVIIGRSGASGDFGGTHKEAWNAVSAPILNLHLWTARNNRLNWLPTGTTSHDNSVGDTIVAKIDLPDDPVFADATIAADSTMDWAVTPTDFMETVSGGNGTVLARDATSGNVFFVRWDPWVRFYDGAADFAAGYRTLIGNGNDNTTPFNYDNFLDDARQVYLNEVARMVDLPAAPEKPAGLGVDVVFVSLPGKDNPDTPEEADADTPFINDLIELEYSVTVVYSTSLETATQGFVDTLNAADLVIIGRSGSSGDFGGTHKEAWNAITSPLLNLHLWTARNSRLNWLNSGTTSHDNSVGDTIVARIELPNDPVFADATIAADSTMDWAYTPTDYMEATDAGNGTVLARDASSGNVFFVRWDPWVEFFEGAGDRPAGYRSLIGNGNDNTTPFNYYNFTEEANQVYLNEVARMSVLGKVDEPVAIEGGKGNIPVVYDLRQNYPNPFNPETNITFSLSKAGNTTLKIYNTLGQLITTLVDKDMQAGVYSVSFDAAALSSGVYFYRIESGNYINIKKMTLIK